MASELFTEIEIEASAEQVWGILTDFAAYPDWNPFIRRMHGTPEAGQQLEGYIQPSNARGMTFKPTVLKAEPAQEFRWPGHLIVPGLFDGEHVFTTESLGDHRVRFLQRETFSGILAPLLLRMIGADTKRGFEEMNRALKERAEHRNRA